MRWSKKFMFWRFMIVVTMLIKRHTKILVIVLCLFWQSFFLYCKLFIQVCLLCMEFHFQVAKKSFGCIKECSADFEVWLKKSKEIIHCKTSDQIADILWKPCPKQDPIIFEKAIRNLQQNDEKCWDMPNFLANFIRLCLVLE